ncbi:MAG: orotidine-5'-phosphate decarboxylase [candidate division WOR-3 bacterium]
MTKLILALNVEQPALALNWLERLGEAVDVYKLQMDLFGRAGPELVRRFVARGARVFLDLKFHDIPSVVAKAVQAAAELGVSMLTVHTMGGAKMLSEAVKAARSSGQNRPLILGVTVLTSLDRQALKQVTGLDQEVQNRVLALAELAQSMGCDGVVASPQEVAAIKKRCGPKFIVVTPGIRLGRPGPADDQARTMTPSDARSAGADYIVVGRSIYEAPDPLKVIGEIRAQLGGY